MQIPTVANRLWLCACAVVTCEWNWKRQVVEVRPVLLHEIEKPASYRHTCIHTAGCSWTVKRICVPPSVCRMCNNRISSAVSQCENLQISTSHIYLRIYRNRRKYVQVNVDACCPSVTSWSPNCLRWRAIALLW